jgi:acyl-CoA-dependent ceramide synthase
MQISLYVHLVLLLNAEAPRKDHWQMMAHHVITIVLIVLSYAYNITRVGCLIIVLMDWCDIFLPVPASLFSVVSETLTRHSKLAKMLRYLAFQTACDVTFVCWMLSWFITRHVLFCKVIASTFWDAPVEIEFGWWPERSHWYTKEMHTVFLTLLIILEVSTVAPLWYMSHLIRLLC